MRYFTKGVCSAAIDFDVEGTKLKNVKFTGGCSGNTNGIASLVEGMEIEEVIKRCENIKCGFKNTSCPDQLAKALKEYKNQN